MISTSIIVILLALAVFASLACVVLARRDMDVSWVFSAALVALGLVVPAVVLILMNMGVDLNPYINGDLRWVVALTEH